MRPRPAGDPPAPAPVSAAPAGPASAHTVPPPVTRAARVGWGVVALLGGLPLLVCLAQGTRGLDRTDEGLYLNSIAWPADDRATILLFGYVYHPVYRLLGENVAALRGFGMLLTVLAGSVLAWTALGLSALVGPRPLTAVGLAVTSFVLGSTGLLTVVALPLTPGYNSLVLQGCALAATGVALALFGRGRWVLTGWALVGIGGWFAFLAKPTSAAALAVLVAALVLVNRRLWTPKLVIAPLATVAAAGVCLLAWGVSPGYLEAQLTVGLRTTRLLGAHAQLLRVDVPPHDVRFVLPALGVLALVGAALFVRARGASPWWTVAGLGLAAVVATASAWLWLRDGVTNLVVTNGPTMMVGLLLLPLLGMLVHRGRRADGAASTGRADGIARGSFVAALVLLPFVCAFGTNNNLWMAQGRFAVFWAVAATVLLLRVSHTLALAPVVGAALLLMTYVTGALVSPYHYASFFAAGTPAQVTSHGAGLGLTPYDAQLTNRLLALGKSLGIGNDTRVVDLTGYSAGYIFQLGARPVGQAWLLGGRRRSAAVAIVAIRREPCALREALLLVDARSVSRIDPSTVLDAFGLSLGRDYVKVAGFVPPRAGRSGHHTVTVLRPRGPLQVQGCPATG